MNCHRITLAHKQGASLLVHTHTGFNNHADGSAILIVFLNGLMMPQSAWQPAIDVLLSTRQSVPAMLTYDRYGQGDSDRDPDDPPETLYGHTAEDIVFDLHQLILQVCFDILHIPSPGPGSTKLFVVANSIGCPLARLYASEHPGTVAGFLFLDSMMANTDFVSLFPDPDSDDFDPDELPEDVSVEAIRHARRQTQKMFHPNVPNPEHFDRRNLRQLLPFADKPVMPMGPDGQPPLLTVVGHDPDVFAQQTLKVRFSRVALILLLMALQRNVG